MCDHTNDDCGWRARAFHVVQATLRAGGAQQRMREGSTGNREADATTDPVSVNDVVKIDVLLSFSLEETKVFWRLFRDVLEDCKELATPPPQNLFRMLRPLRAGLLVDFAPPWAGRTLRSLHPLCR